MIQVSLARWAAKKAVEVTVKKQVKVALLMIARDLVRKGLEKLHLRFPNWKFLAYRRYLGL